VLLLVLVLLFLVMLVLLVLVLLFLVMLVLLVLVLLFLVMLVLLVLVLLFWSHCRRTLRRTLPPSSRPPLPPHTAAELTAAPSTAHSRRAFLARADPRDPARPGQGTVRKHCSGRPSVSNNDALRVATSTLRRVNDAWLI
jgi:uncharacterized protein (DUF58 family)